MGRKKLIAKTKLNLALQGGGAHGAFTWGVLDRILEDESIEIGWISGTSAGALNAVALAVGMAEGGAGGCAGRTERGCGMRWDKRASRSLSETQSVGLRASADR